MHQGADLDLLERAIAADIAGEVEIGGILHLDEAVALVGEEPHYDARIADGAVLFHLALADGGDLLELALDRLEDAIDDSGAVALHLAPFLLALADHGIAPGDVDLDDDAERRLGSLGTTVRYLNDNARTGDVVVEALQPLHPFANECLQ